MNIEKKKKSWKLVNLFIFLRPTLFWVTTPSLQTAALRVRVRRQNKTDGKKLASYALSRLCCLARIIKYHLIDKCLYHDLRTDHWIRMY